MPRFDAVRACVFDAYGTLFDVHCAVGQHRERLPAGADADLNSLAGLPGLPGG